MTETKGHVLQPTGRMMFGLREVWCPDCRSGFLDMYGGRCPMGPRAPKSSAPEPPSLDLIAHLHAQRAWSLATFGPGMAETNTAFKAYIDAELAEVEPDELRIDTWVDTIFVALDGAMRAGHEPQDIAGALAEKLRINEGRRWPDWRTVPEGEPIEHEEGGE